MKLSSLEIETATASWRGGLSTLLLSASLALVLVLSPAGRAGAVERLVITGSSTIAPLVLQIARRYEQAHPGLRIDVQSGGSSRGLTDVRRGVADIGMVSRALRAPEKDLDSYLIAIDEIGIILHASNPLDALTVRQVKQIYTGKLRNWRDLGGVDRPITVVNKAEGRSTLEVFLQRMQLKNSSIRAHVIVGENQQGIKTVAGNPGAIAYVSSGTARYETARGSAIRLVPLVTSAGNAGGVAAPMLTRKLNLVTAREPSTVTQGFIRFARSAAVYDLIRREFFAIADNP